jgi:RecA-family ATPase
VPDVYLGGTYLSQAFPDLPYIVEKGLIPTAMKGVIFGPPKKGKSVVLNQLAISVIHGIDWFGFKTNQKRVLYMNFEVGHKGWQTRLHKYCKSTGLVLNNNLLLVSDLMGIRLDTPSGQAELEKLVSVHKPHLVIFDPFYKTVTTLVEENTVVSTDFMDKLIFNYGVSVFICHHARKTKITQGGIVELGSQEMMGGHLARWVDSIISLMPVAQDKVKLEFECRHSEEPLRQINLELDRNMAGFKVVP